MKYRMIIALLLGACLIFLTACAVGESSDKSPAYDPDTSSADALHLQFENQKMALLLTEETIHIPNGEELLCEIGIRNFSPYEYLRVTLTSTDGIDLLDCEEHTIPYAETPEPIQLAFQLTDAAVENGIVLVCKKAQYQTITVHVEVYRGDVLQQTQRAEVSVLPTEYGTFIDQNSNISAYTAYINHLRKKKIDQSGGVEGCQVVHRSL